MNGFCHERHAALGRTVWRSEFRSGHAHHQADRIPRLHVLLQDLARSSKQTNRYNAQLFLGGFTLEASTVGLDLNCSLDEAFAAFGLDGLYWLSELTEQKTSVGSGHRKPP